MVFMAASSPSDLGSPGRRKAVVVWGCGRAFLATPSLPQMRTASPVDEDNGSTGVRSGSLGWASIFTLALMTVSLSLTPERCEAKGMRNRTLWWKNTNSILPLPTPKFSFPSCQPIGTIEIKLTWQTLVSLLQILQSFSKCFFFFRFPLNKQQTDKGYNNMKHNAVQLSINNEAKRRSKQNKTKQNTSFSTGTSVKHCTSFQDHDNNHHIS